MYMSSGLCRIVSVTLILTSKVMKTFKMYNLSSLVWSTSTCETQNLVNWKEDKEFDCKGNQFRKWLEFFFFCLFVFLLFNDMKSVVYSSFNIIHVSMNVWQTSVTFDRATINLFVHCFYFMFSFFNWVSTRVVRVVETSGHWSVWWACGTAYLARWLSCLTGTWAFKILFVWVSQQGRGERKY